MATIIIRGARLAFHDALWEAKQYEGQGPFKYRTNFLIPADDAQRKVIGKAIVEVAKAKWGEKAKAVLDATNAQQKICFIDGDTKEYNGYAGNWALTATRDVGDGPVQICGNSLKQKISSQDGIIYSGCYVNGKVDLWAQDNKFGKTVRATLIAVQFVKDGESFGGAAPASVDGLDDLAFEDSPEDAQDDFSDEDLY